MPVDWLLMDGCTFCIKRASVMDNLLWLNSVNNIFVLFTRLWLARACCFGHPDAKRNFLTLHHVNSTNKKINDFTWVACFFTIYLLADLHLVKTQFYLS